MSRPLSAAFLLAHASISSDRSTDVTLCPRSASCMETIPGPHPTSRMFSGSLPRIDEKWSCQALRSRMSENPLTTKSSYEAERRFQWASMQSIGRGMTHTNLILVLPGGTPGGAHSLPFLDLW
ncbi:MAG: hypothetical protein Q4Q62_02495 [Thermoplasmata archaeon]|nr:hypothetical protein [Thermoplasmata archaeon]